MVGIKKFTQEEAKKRQLERSRIYNKKMYNMVHHPEKVIPVVVDTEEAIKKYVLKNKIPFIHNKNFTFDFFG